jgi:multiple sugar transport system permease protein
MRSQAVGWLLLAPTLLVLAVFGLGPFIYVLITGFTDWNAFAADPTARFAGIWSSMHSFSIPCG